MARIREAIDLGPDALLALREKALIWSGPYRDPQETS